MANLNIDPGFDTFHDQANTRFIITKDVVLGSRFNAGVTGTANIFGTDLVPNSFPTNIRVWIDIDASPAVDLILIRKKGGVSKESTIGTGLTANKPFIMDNIPFATTGETLNLRTTATVAYNVGYVAVIEKIEYL